MQTPQKRLHIIGFNTDLFSDSTILTTISFPIFPQKSIKISFKKVPIHLYGFDPQTIWEYSSLLTPNDWASSSVISDSFFWSSRLNFCLAVFQQLLAAKRSKFGQNDNVWWWFLMIFYVDCHLSWLSKLRPPWPPWYQSPPPWSPRRTFCQAGVHIAALVGVPTVTPLIRAK